MLVALAFQGSAEEMGRPEFFMSAAAEGMAGGAMLCMISSQLLPEATHRAGDLAGTLYLPNSGCNVPTYHPSFLPFLSSFFLP